MDDILVSVIVPVYNTSCYLEKCITSICNQTYKNLEIICVDDGSTDDSWDILQEWTKRDERVKAIHIENKGSSGARNVGIDYAHGDYLTFVDSDDWLNLQMYEKLVENVSDTVGISSCGYYFAYQDRVSLAENEEYIENMRLCGAPFGVDELRRCGCRHEKGRPVLCARRIL